MTHRMVADSDTQPRHYRVMPMCQGAYGVFNAIAQTCTDVIQSLPQRGEFELEIRFGALDPLRNTFKPEISADFWNSSLALLRSYTSWTEVVEPVEYEDTYYTVGNQTVRTRAIALDGGKMDITHIYKKRADVWDFRTHAHEATANKLPDMRVALSIELPCTSVPSHTKPTRVSITQRYSFLYTPTGWNRAVIRFDLTNSWSDVTRSLAEQKQALGQAGSRSMEIECFDSAYMQETTHGASYVVASLIAKMMDFIRHNNANLCENPYSVSLEPILKGPLNRLPLKTPVQEKVAYIVLNESTIPIT